MYQIIGIDKDRPPKRYGRARSPRLPQLVLAVGLAMALLVSMTSPILAHEGHSGSGDSNQEYLVNGVRPPTRIEFMREGMPAADLGLIGGPNQPTGVSHGLAIGGTAGHQPNLVVISAPSGPDVTTTSQDWQQIPDLHASIGTPSNASLAISVSAEASVSDGGRMFARAVIDGQPANPSDVVLARGGFDGAQSFTFVVSNLGYGTHKVVLEWRVDAGHTGYMGDRSLTVSASSDAAERRPLAVVAAPSGPDVSTAEQSWQPVPQLATTVVTAAGADLAITVSAETETTNNGRLFVRALVDGQPTTPSDMIFARGSYRGTRAFTFTVQDVPAGEHNVQMQWVVDEAATGFMGDRTLVVVASPSSTQRDALAVTSAPSGPPVTTTVNGWQPIPNLESSISVPANSDLTVTLSAEAHTSSSGRMFVRALIDGRPSNPSDAILARGDYSGARAFTFTLQDVPAGNHTVQLQWSIDVGYTGYLGDRSMVVTAGQRERQHLWIGIGGLQTNVTPAVEGLEDANAGAIYVVAISTTGQVQFTRTATPTVFDPWQTVAGELAAAPDTAPALIRYADQLLLVVRGADDNLYESHIKLGQPWAAWEQLTTDGSAQGSFSVALSPAPLGATRVHVLYQGASDQLHYRSFVNAYQDGDEHIWNGALQGQLGSNGDDTLMAVVLTSERRGEIYRLSPTATGSWQHELTISPSGPEGGIYDVSNTVFFAGSFHLGFAVKESTDDVSIAYRHVIKHLQVRADDFQDNAFHDIASYAPSGDRHASTELVLYRNKLLAAFTTPDGQVHQARWDTADPDLVWVGEGIVDDSHTAKGRPNLGVFNMRAFHPWGDAEYGISNYGDDAIAVMTDSASGMVNLINFSRAIFLRDIDAQLTLYHGIADHTGSDGKRVADPAPTPLLDPTQDGRPFMSELGYALWTLPYWLADGTYEAIARLACQNGTNTSGRFDPPCDEARYPVIVRPGGSVYIASGIWHTQFDNYLKFWEELGHTTAGTMGFNDDGQGGSPTQVNADLVPGISLDALKAAYELFGERTAGRANPAGQAPGGRERGFTGIANNYDAGSRQHSFIYVVYYYVSDGDRLRAWIADDLAAGDDLLQRKYEWVRTHIYKGVEFQRHNTPLTN